MKFTIIVEEDLRTTTIHILKLYDIVFDNGKVLFNKIWEEVLEPTVKGAKIQVDNDAFIINQYHAAILSRMLNSELGCPK